MWFIGVEVEQETSAPPPNKKPGSAPVINRIQEKKRLVGHLEQDSGTKRPHFPSLVFFAANLDTARTVYYVFLSLITHV